MVVHTGIACADPLLEVPSEIGVIVFHFFNRAGNSVPYFRPHSLDLRILFYILRFFNICLKCFYFVLEAFSLLIVTKLIRFVLLFSQSLQGRSTLYRTIF